MAATNEIERNPAGAQSRAGEAGANLSGGLEVKDPSICPCGNKYLWCDNPACVDEMCEAEAAAYCPHGFLCGCPVC